MLQHGQSVQVQLFQRARPSFEGSLDGSFDGDIPATFSNRTPRALSGEYAARSVHQNGAAVTLWPANAPFDAEATSESGFQDNHVRTLSSSFRSTIEHGHIPFGVPTGAYDMNLWPFTRVDDRFLAPHRTLIAESLATPSLTDESERGDSPHDSPNFSLPELSWENVDHKSVLRNDSPVTPPHDLFLSSYWGSSSLAANAHEDNEDHREAAPVPAAQNHHSYPQHGLFMQPVDAISQINSSAARHLQQDIFSTNHCAGVFHHDYPPGFLQQASDTQAYGVYVSRFENAPSHAPELQIPKSVKRSAKKAASGQKLGFSIEPGLQDQQPVSKHRRDEEDRLLVHLKQKDKEMTYKRIKEILKTNVAESTLRGRYRSLTKDKHERVRKPVWTDEDIRLLHQIVSSELEQQSMSLPRSQRLTKISWIKVANFIKQNGGSYKFGNSTCKKKWIELSSHF